MCITCPDFTTRIDALGNALAKRLLGCKGSIPRVLLMHELDVSLRLSTEIHCNAAMLFNRIILDERYSDLQAVLNTAKNHKTTWTAAVEKFMQRIGAKSIQQYHPRIALRQGHSGNML